MIEPSYIYGLIGGLIIGLAGAVYLLGNGRIMGASGVIGGLVDGSGLNEWRDRLLFIVGLIAAPWLALLVLGIEGETKITSNPWV
ncbi:MAG: YeeE/YedE family protein, partial [Boseongicola sp.]|nr:YeeE/YedE family protein [Boseongicola sp.]